jgi:hypothetical protein
MKRIAFFLAMPLLSFSIAQAQVAGPVNVGPNEYAFQYTSNPNIGLFFNGTDGRYEFKDGSASPAFWLAPQLDRSYFRGRVGIGTQTPGVMLHVNGASRFGDTLDFARIDQDGDLTFNGTADFLVENNRYAFRAKSNENYGLFFNAADQRYEYRDQSGNSVHNLGANGGSAEWFDENGDLMMRHNGNNLKVASLGVSSGLVLEGSDVTTQVRVELDNNLNGGQNWILQSTSNGTPVGGGKFSIRNENQGINAFVMDSLGNVGIGNDLPFAKLDVDGSLRIGTNAGFPVEGMLRWSGSDFEGYDGSSWQSLTATEGQAWTGTNTIVSSYRVGQTRIGTSGTYSDDQVVIESNGFPNPLRVRVGSATKFYVTNTGGVSIGANFTSPPSDGLYVNGDVTIGTQTPATGYKLSVNGKVMCEELTVELSGDWPDYVFAPQYQRPALPELKQAIQELGHLPGVPSASDVADGGIHVGDMQATLLEKVEELTLYIIELEERLATVEGR